MNNAEKLQEAKVTTLRRVLLARSCARVGERMCGRGRGHRFGGVRVAGRGTRNRGDRREEVEVNPKRRSLGNEQLFLIF